MIPRTELIDLGEQHRELGVEIEAAVRDVLRSQRFILSEEVSAFEAEWGELCGVGRCVGVGSGTDALWLALRGCGIGRGDRVVVPAYTFIATYEAVVRCGAEPILADVAPETGCLDPASVARAAEAAGGARAVLAVHLYGIPCDTEELAAALQPWGGFVVEDAAQAHGAVWRGRPAGSLGRCAAFSFYPTKNLAAAGDAGAVTTCEAAVEEEIRSLRDHGRIDRYRHGKLGSNSRLDAVQAAVLRVKLRHLGSWTESRRRVAGWWFEALEPLEAEGRLLLPRAPAGAEPSWHLFPIRVEADRREALGDCLEQAGMAFGHHYPLPLHHQPAVRDRIDTERCPSGLSHSEAWSREVITLPCHPHVEREAVERAARALG